MSVKDMQKFISAASMSEKEIQEFLSIPRLARMAGYFAEAEVYLNFGPIRPNEMRASISTNPSTPNPPSTALVAGQQLQTQKLHDINLKGTI
jgi:hypothetical protein